MLTPAVTEGADTGIDAETLKMTLDTIKEFVAKAMPEERQLELDHEDICPEDLVRAMCSDELGVHLLFIPEEYGGMGCDTVDVYRICEQMARPEPWPGWCTCRRCRRC